jgi:hypothetical protein
MRSLRSIGNAITCDLVNSACQQRSRSSLKSDVKEVKMSGTAASSTATICVEEPSRPNQELHSTLWRHLADRWQRHTDRQLAASVRALDHSGVMADFESAQRHG